MSNKLSLVLFGAVSLLLLIVGCGGPENPPGVDPPGTKPPVTAQKSKLTVVMPDTVKVNKLLIDGKVWATDVSGKVSKELEPGKYVLLPKINGMVSYEAMGGGTAVEVQKGKDATVEFTLSPLAVDLRGVTCEITTKYSLIKGTKFTPMMFFNNGHIKISNFKGFGATYIIEGNKLIFKRGEETSDGTVTVNDTQVDITIVHSSGGIPKYTETYKCTRPPTD